MRSHPIAVVLASLALVTGCSGGAGTGDTASSTQAPQEGATTTTSSLEAHTAAPGAVGQSPAGVTTAVGADSVSTEEEYFQACQAARTWMTEQGGDMHAQFEPYLANLQSTDSAGPGTFGIPWSQLPPPRQAAVIVAAEAAANEMCG